MSVSDYCASNPCVATWPSDPTAFCSIPGDTGDFRVGTSAGHFVAEVSDGVIVDDWLFDASTGALVAVLREGQGLPTCLAGPGSFDVPAYDSGTSVTHCSDAGTP